MGRPTSLPIAFSERWEKKKVVEHWEFEIFY